MADEKKQPEEKPVELPYEAIDLSDDEVEAASGGKASFNPQPDPPGRRP